MTRKSDFMNKKKVVVVTLLLIFSLIAYIVFSIDNTVKLDSVSSKNEKMISMYIVDEAGGEATSETDTVPEGYKVDRYTCDKANDTTVSIIIENNKLKITSNGAVSCKVYLVLV